MLHPWTDPSHRFPTAEELSAHKREHPGEWHPLATESDTRADALIRLAHRVGELGGFHRTAQGDFWISRNDVMCLIHEELGQSEDHDE